MLSYLKLMWRLYQLRNLRIGACLNQTPHIEHSLYCYVVFAQNAVIALQVTDTLRLTNHIQSGVGESSHRCKRVEQTVTQCLC